MRKGSVTFVIDSINFSFIPASLLILLTIKIICPILCISFIIFLKKIPDCGLNNSFVITNISKSDLLILSRVILSCSSLPAYIPGVSINNVFFQLYSFV